MLYLANDLGPQQIRVNAIFPGPMKTLAGAAIGGARATFRHTEANAPMRSNATLEAIGGPAVWLCSEYGACTTGEVVHVDGGYHVLGMPQSEGLRGGNVGERSLRLFRSLNLRNLEFCDESLFSFCDRLNFTKTSCA